jgi:hypothetical protein
MWGSPQNDGAAREGRAGEAVPATVVSGNVDCGLPRPTGEELVGACYVLSTRFGVDAHDAVVGKHRRLAIGPLMLAAHGATQAAIQIGMRFLEITDDFEVDALDLREIDLLDVDKPEQLAHRLGHFAPAFVARTPALRDTDLRPELFLVQPQATPDLARIKDSVE